MKALIVFIIILNLISCGDDGSNCPGDVNLPIEISPYKFFYNVGDTITISSKFYKLIYDQKTDKFYDAINYKFSPDISMYLIDSSEPTYLGSQVLQYCNYINLDSSKMIVLYSGGNTTIAGEYSIKIDTLYFEFQLKLKKKGFFRLSTESLSSGDGHLQNNYMFNCRGREIIFDLVNPQENNIKLLQSFRAIYPNDWILSDSINRFYNYAGYCFEVR